MKVIVQHGPDNCVYVYREAESHHANVEPHRAEAMKRKTLRECDEECELSHGEYVVADVVERRSKPKRKEKK